MKEGKIEFETLAKWVLFFLAIITISLFLLSINPVESITSAMSKFRSMLK